MCHLLRGVVRTPQDRVPPPGGGAPTDAGELIEGEEDDPLTCAICGSGEASAANPMVKCDGEHETEFGVHLRCMEPPMDSPPEDEWFCVKCQEKSLYQVEAIVDKKDKMKRPSATASVPASRASTTKSSGRAPSGREKTRGSRSRTCRRRA